MIRINMERGTERDPHNEMKEIANTPVRETERHDDEKIRPSLWANPRTECFLDLVPLDYLAAQG